MTKRVAISSSVYPDPDTHIETVTYGDAGDSMSALFTLLVGDGTRLTRPLKLLGAMLRHPVRLARVSWPRGWSRRTIIVLVMQSLDNAIALRARRGPFGGVRLTTEQDPERPNPTFIPVANQFAEWLAERTGGIAQSSLMEAVANIPTTAHILGGAVIGADRSTRRRRRAPARLRLREPPGLRRIRDPGERRREPEPHDHRARRARDEPRARRRPRRRVRALGGVTVIDDDPSGR